MTFRDLLHLMTTLAEFRLFEISGTVVTVGTVVAAGLVMLAASIVSRVVRAAFDRILARDDIRDPGTLRAGQRLAHFLIMLIGVGVALETVGFDLTALFTAGAVFAVGIGFAMQNVAQNFVSGVILLLERTIKPGDVLEVEGAVVRVERMGIRSTVARTLDDEEIIVPNATLVQGSVKNFTLSDSLFRLRAVVGVTYGEDMAKVREVLETTAAAIDWRVGDKAPRVHLKEFADSAVVFEVSVWVTDPWRSRGYASDLNEAIWWALKEAGIVIAFPQLDLHLDPAVVAALSARRGTAPAG